MTRTDTVPAPRVRPILLLRAFETAAADSPLWTADDRAWASRAARERLGAAASPPDFIAERAALAMQRLLPRLPQARPLLDAPACFGRTPALAVVALALAAGLLADSLARATWVDLLAPPMWAVLAWNLCVYALLLTLALRRRPSPPAAWLTRLLHGWTGPSLPADAAAELCAFARAWSAVAAPSVQACAAAVFHAAAAALALGLVAGLYARGLVLDYRAGWQSTFLDAGAVHAWLATLLAPASHLTGITIPGTAEVAALRVTPAAPASASAAGWIHLFAATLALAVIVPRLLLAALARWQARRRWAQWTIPPDDPYYAALLRQAAAGVGQVWVLPHAAPLPANAALGLRALLAEPSLPDPQLHIAAPTPYGAEAQPEHCTPAPGSTSVVLVVELGATPEAEVHGLWLQTVRRAAGTLPVQLLVDESAFVARFGGDATRRKERQALWQAFARSQPVALQLACLSAVAPPRPPQAT